MAGQPPSVSLILFSDGGECLLDGVDDEEQQDALRGIADFLQSSIQDVAGLPQFRHVQLMLVDTSEQTLEGVSPLSLAFASASDEAADVSGVPENLYGKLDLKGFLLGGVTLPTEVAGRVGIAVAEDTPELKCLDEALGAKLSDVLKRINLGKRYNKFISGQEELLQDALAAAFGGGDAASALDLYDVVRLAIMQVAQVAGVAPPQPSLFGRGRRLVGRVLSAPAGLLQQARKRVTRVQRLWWALEDIVVDGGRAAAKLAVKAARPVLVVFVLHRALQSLSRSRSLWVQLSKMPEKEAVEYYYTKLLGKDWKEQMQADWDKAVQDVNDGLVTDEINHEKRKMTAAALRRLEIEEWDKQRMKHFHMSNFGGLRWFDMMQQQLQNPLFISSRGWTDQVPNWVGENQVYMNDLPGSRHWLNLGATAIRLKERELGRPLTVEEKRRTVEAGSPALRFAGLVPHTMQPGVSGSGTVALAAAAALAPR